MPSPSRAARLIASLDPSSQTPAGWAPCARARPRRGARARARLAHEQHELGQLAWVERAGLSWGGRAWRPRRSRPRGTVRARSVRQRGRADERQLDAAAEQAAEDLVARGDLDLDGDAGVVAAEAAERVGQQVDAGRGRGAEMDRPGLQAGEGASSSSAALRLASAWAARAASTRPASVRRLPRPFRSTSRWPARPRAGAGAGWRSAGRSRSPPLQRRGFLAVRSRRAAASGSCPRAPLERCYPSPQMISGSVTSSRTM